MTSLPLALARGARHRWRRSLQLRMVTTTLLLSTVVALLIGVTILHQVQSGLLGAANRSALSQLGIGVERAQSQFAALPHSDPASVETTAQEVANELQDRNNDSTDDAYDVVMLSTSGLRSYTPDGVTSSIPKALQRAVSRTSSEAWTYTEIRRNDGTSAPGLIVGAPVTAANLQYQIFYLFPLTREAQTIALVERTMLFAGAGLVLLLAGIAALVTRQVVRPVRQARRDRRAPRGGPAQGADERPRRGRPRHPGRLLQPDGRHSAAPDLAAARALSGATPVRRRRVPRAADADHDDPDGRRPAPRRDGGARRRSWPARPSCCSNSSTASSCCSPTCSRSAGTMRVPPCWRPSPPTSVAWWPR